MANRFTPVTPAKQRAYWEYVVRTTTKEAEFYKKLLGDVYYGSADEKWFNERLAEARANLAELAHVEG